MKMLHLLLAAGVAAIVPPALLAQTDVPVPDSAASAAPTAKPEKRNLSPSELRDSATTPGDLRPESRVTPQFDIPLNPNTPPKVTFVRPPRGGAGQSGDIDDSAARCAALADEHAREQCHDKYSR